VGFSPLSERDSAEPPWIWVSQDIARIGDALELLVSALCLTSVHLLSRENRDRRKTDANTRLWSGAADDRQGFSEPNRR